jgi:hypothetical protein
MAAAVVMPLKPLFLQNATNYTALDLRDLIESGFNEGVDGQSDLSVSQRAAGTNMSVDVDFGTAVIQGNSPAGSRYYMIRNDSAPTNVTLDAAPGSNSRIDLIVATVRDAAVGGGANNDWVLQAVTGTAGASPTPPAVPNNSIELARVTVASGTSAITNAMITDRRASMHRLARYFNAQPAVVTPGQLISDYGTGRVLRGETDGSSYVDINALVMELTTRAGGSMVGGTPPPNAGYKWEFGTSGVAFTAGAGVINFQHTFSGICFVTAITIGNSQAYVISRRTAGDSIDGTHFPITAIAVSALGTANASGTITVSYFVVGW